MGLHQIKSFCAVKETISKTKRKPAEWEKILANDTTNIELISKTYKELIQHSIFTKNNKKQAEDLKTRFFKEDTQMAKGTQHH